MTVKRSRTLVAVCALAGLACAEAAGEADPSRIVVNPDAYLGRRVAIAVKFLRAEPGRERWEEQANLNPSAVIKFKVTRLGDVNCYIPRTPRNAAAVERLAKGDRIILSGVPKRYRTKVVTDYEVSGKGHRRVREVKRTVRGRVRYGFMVDSIARDE